MPKLQPIKNDEIITGYMFYCPGCKSHHAPYIRPHKNPLGASWNFNGDLESPTFNPSILTRVTPTEPDRDPLVCHLFVKGGQIEYLNDCTHELKGKTIKMEEVE